MTVYGIQYNNISYQMDYEMYETLCTCRFEPVPEKEVFRHVYHRVQRYLVFRYHPKMIEVTGIPEGYGKTCNGCGLYAYGRSYRNIIDEEFSRFIAATDRQGYLINQGMLEEIPFGYFNTKEKGCGWIAAWNMFRYNGIDLTMKQVRTQLEQHALLGKVAGQSIGQLYRLIRHYLPVAISLPFHTFALQKIEHCTCGILLYQHTHGSHYVFFHRVDRDTFRFCNAVYGRQNHIMTMESFLKTYGFLPFSSVIVL
ncbi:MAG: hypothetical protein ACI32N_02865 [Bulleidia sp.]